MKTLYKTFMFCVIIVTGTCAATYLIQCKRGDTLQQDVAAAVKAKDSTTVEFTELYRPAKDIPYGGEDTIHAGHILRKMGFTQTDYGWGNGMPPAISIRSAHYHKKGCDCDVYKLYNETNNKDLYTITESITCYPSQKK